MLRGVLSAQYIFHWAHMRCDEALILILEKPEKNKDTV